MFLFELIVIVENINRLINRYNELLQINP